MSLTDTFRGRTLRWTLDSIFSKEYKLFADSEQIGDLLFPKFLSTSADITLLDRKYEAFSPSAFKSRMDLKEKDTNKIVASLLREKLLGPTEIIVGEKIFNFESTFFQRSFFIKSQAGSTLIEFQMNGMFKLQCTVKADPSFLQQEEFPLLVIFIWYLIIRLSNRRAAAGV